MAQSADIAEKLKELEKRFKARLSGDIEAIKTLQSEADLDNLISICHKLAGSAGTFGFQNLSMDMKEFELKLIKLKQTQISESAFNQLKIDACQIIEKVTKA